jgi:hypothetical protein
MTSLRRFSLPLLLLLGAALSGCGVLFTKGPPAGHEQMSSFHCTTDGLGPVVDIVIGVASLFGGIVIANDPESFGYEDGSAALTSGLVWGAILGISAGIGFNKVNKCEAAQRDLARRHPRPITPGAEPLGEPADRVTVTPALDSIDVGQVVQLTATGFRGRSVVNASPFRWTSSDDAVAWVVVRSGLVTAVAPGTVVIAASASNNTVGTATIVVRSPK